MELKKIFIQPRGLYDVELRGHGNCWVLTDSKTYIPYIPYILTSEADKEKAELVKALEQYGSHIGTCPRRAWSAEQVGCTCGFDKALHNPARGPNARRADSGAGEGA